MITEKTNPTATPVMKAIMWLKRTIINSSFLAGLEVQSVCPFAQTRVISGLQEIPFFLSSQKNACSVLRVPAGHLTTKEVEGYNSAPAYMLRGFGRGVCEKV